MTDIPSKIFDKIANVLGLRMIPIHSDKAAFMTPTSHCTVKVSNGVIMWHHFAYVNSKDLYEFWVDLSDPDALNKAIGGIKKQLKLGTNEC